ncbi:hypothetical protein PIB30_001203 [Stylosanthes scabra]|uniref:Uncharacterized protein n=1 Tax=Stylosanthes scabra TaxID=79078 RepID=A0ABU6W276_9FABA|nr:hypothetical protein [Stylosanthes scabra]
MASKNAMIVFIGLLAMAAIVPSKIAARDIFKAEGGIGNDIAAVEGYTPSPANAAEKSDSNVVLQGLAGDDNIQRNKISRVDRGAFGKFGDEGEDVREYFWRFELEEVVQDLGKTDDVLQKKKNMNIFVVVAMVVAIGCVLFVKVA